MQMFSTVRQNLGINIQLFIKLFTGLQQKCWNVTSFFKGTITISSDTVLEVPNCYFKEFLKHNINDSYKFQELAMFRKVEESIRRRNGRKDLVSKFDFELIQKVRS